MMSAQPLILVAQIAAKAQLTIDQAIAVYAEMHGLRIEDLVGPSKAPAITAYRHELMFLIRRMNPAASFYLIGRFLGGRDMATVHEAVIKVERRLQLEDGYAGHLQSLMDHMIRIAIARTDPVERNPKPWQVSAAISVLRDGQVTDGEARKAALVILQQLEVAHG